MNNDYQDLTNEALARRFEMFEEQIKQFQDERLQVLMEIERRMGEMNALATVGYDIIRKVSGWIYNENSMTAKVKELITADEWEKLRKTVSTTKWDGVKINSLIRRYGGEIAEGVESSRTPTRAYTTVKRKNNNTKGD